MASKAIMAIKAILELAAIPAPGLGTALQLAHEIWVLVEEINIGKVQLEVLANCATQLLSSLHPQYRSGKLKESNTEEPLQELQDLLSEILNFIYKQRQIGFLKSILIKDERKASIENFHKRITASVSAFQIASLINIIQWQSNHDQAQMDDRRALKETLRWLEANTVRLDEALLRGQKSPRAVMATLQKTIEKEDDKYNPEELDFFRTSLSYLRTASGQRVDMQPWTITSVEVEFGDLIGIGGFGKVFRGKWNRMDVALKVMKNNDDISPTAATIKHEVETWSSVKHPHILQFLGANILDNEPFIVMPFIKNGDARSYLMEHPESDRTKLAHQISLALCYLHNVPIIHGDLKLVNVLIDDGGNALLSDFGLARMKQDMMSRSTRADSNTLLGSHNWMAPELFEGSNLRRSCDIYSFAMTLYEIFTLEIPLGHVSPNRLPDLVCQHDRRPEKPEPEDATQLTDTMWNIIEQCWVSGPTNRPTAAAISDKLAVLLNRRSTLDPMISQPFIDNSNYLSTSPPALSRTRSGSTSSSISPYLSPPSPNSIFPSTFSSPLSASSSNSLGSIPEMHLPASFGPGGELAAVFLRAKPVRFRQRIVKPEAGRYHLYVSYACPWSMETLIARSLKQLEGVIPITVLSPVVDEFGWSFSAPTEAIGGPLGDTGRLQDLYLKDNPHYDGFFTLPVLWDKMTKTILSNDAPEIVQLFGVAFNDLTPPRAHRSVKSIDFFPGDENMRKRIKRWTDKIDFASAAIYTAGYADSKAKHDAAVKEVFAVLDKVEIQLRGSSYLLGRSTLSEADLRLFAFLIPFDAVFTVLFKCNFKSIRHDYPNIHHFLRNWYWGYPAFKDAVNFDHIKEHYYMSHHMLNPTRIAPLGPGHFILPLEPEHRPERLLSTVFL